MQDVVIYNATVSQRIQAAIAKCHTQSNLQTTEIVHSSEGWEVHSQ